MRVFFSACVWLATCVAAHADVDRLMAALQFDAVVDTMVAEERAHGAALAEGFFPDAPQDGWQDRVDSIHTIERATGILRREMAEVFADYDLEPMIAYFETDAAQIILGLEASARAAFSDQSLVEAIQADIDGLIAARPELFDQIQDYIEYTDLVEQNVQAAFLSNVAFAAGLIEGGQFQGMAPERLAAEMWAGEDATRADTENWLNAFLMTAYGPANPEDLQIYINSALTPDGTILNAAINRAFQRLYAETSFDMGQAVAEFMGGDEI